MNLTENLTELTKYITFSLRVAQKELLQGILSNVLDLGITVNASVRPEKLINELLEQRRAGKFTFTGEKEIKDIHVTAGSKTYINPNIDAKIGGGPAGADNITIPGGAYLSEDKNTKVEYNSIVFSPLSINYQQDVYKLINQSLKVNGLRFGSRSQKIIW